MLLTELRRRSAQTITPQCRFFLFYQKKKKKKKKSQL